MGSQYAIRFGLFALMIASLVGCGQSTADRSEIEDKEKQLVELREQVAELEEEIAQETKAAPAPTTAPAPPPSPRTTAAPRTTTASAPAPPPPAPPPARAEPASTTIPAGTNIVIRTTSEISTKRVRAGDIFSASLEQPLVIGGRTIAPKGARVTGRIAQADEGGRVKGRAQLAVGLSSLVARGQTVEVSTDTVSITAEGSKKEDALKVGIATGVGAAIGAIAGGGKGAAIGAGAGAGAGTGAVLLTRGDAAVLPAESVLDFTLTAPATISN